MSAVFILIVLGGAIWLVLNRAGGSVHGPATDSVEEFARAMKALDPTAPRPHPARTPRPGPPQRQRGPGPRRPARRH